MYVQNVFVNYHNSSTVNISRTEQHIPVTMTTGSGNQETEHSVALAQQFVKWFYSMLNSHNPDVNVECNDTYGSQHFYADCVMKLACATPELRLEQFSTADIVSKRLLSFIVEERIVFNPNIEPVGVQWLVEPHGLRVVMACGTLHQCGNLVGIFEQQFGIAQDPFMENSWKIRYTYLKMKSDITASMPSLETTRRVLALPE